MLKIRLSRAGKNDSAFFRVVLTEHSASAKHGYIKVLGFYNPYTKVFSIKDIEEIKKHVSNGAQLSPRVEKLLKVNNIAL